MIFFNIPRYSHEVSCRQRGNLNNFSKPSLRRICDWCFHQPHTITLLLAISTILLPSCNPDDDQPKYLGAFTLGAEGEAYIKFEPGSYWIYENDVTNERDTQVMLYYKSKMLHFKGKRNEYDREDIEFSWQGNSGTYQFENGQPYVDATPAPLVEAMQFECSRLGFGVSSLFYFPFNPEWGGRTSGQISKFRTLHDSLQVSGNWFYDVAEFEVDKDWIWKGENNKYFWAKNVGLIKKERYYPLDKSYEEGWYLIEHFVVQ